MLRQQNAKNSKNFSPRGRKTWGAVPHLSSRDSTGLREYFLMRWMGMDSKWETFSNSRFPALKTSSVPNDCADFFCGIFELLHLPYDIRFPGMVIVLNGDEHCARSARGNCFWETIFCSCKGQLSCGAGVVVGGSALDTLYRAIFKTYGFYNMWVANAFKRMGGRRLL